MHDAMHASHASTARLHRLALQRLIVLTHMRFSATAKSACEALLAMIWRGKAQTSGRHYA